MPILFLSILAILALSVLLLCVGILIKGKFPNTHVSKTRHGISCAKTQDTEERTRSPYAVNEHSARS